VFSDFFNRFISQKKLYFLILFIIVLLFLALNMDISIMLFVAIIFATALDPLVEKLEKKMNRPMATTVVLLGFLLVVAIFVLPILYLSVYEVVEFAKAFPQYIINIDRMIQKTHYLHAFGVTHFDTEFIGSAFANSSADIFQRVLAFMSQTSAALLYIFTAIVLLFFFLVDKEQIKMAIIKLFPIEYREKTSSLIDTIGKKLSGYVFAQTLVSGSVWITMTIGLLIFKINYAILLGVIAGVLSIIPIVGSGISLVICLIATYEMGLKYLIIVTVLYTLSHFIENHVVRPYVYSKFLKLHQVIIFIALIIGAKYQGVLGVILAPPFAMALYVLLEELYVKKMEEK